MNDVMPAVSKRISNDKLKNHNSVRNLKFLVDSCRQRSSLLYMYMCDTGKYYKTNNISIFLVTESTTV